MVSNILNLEIILNTRFPTLSDYKLRSFQGDTIYKVSSIRFNRGLHNLSNNLKARQKYWHKYRRPEVEGFYTE
jgi:hypothetical protein